MVSVAYDIAKIYIWKQITTCVGNTQIFIIVAYDIAKIYIWKQITTQVRWCAPYPRLLMILQRYTFGSKSQPTLDAMRARAVAYDIAKIYIWKQITTYDDNRGLKNSCL